MWKKHKYFSFSSVSHLNVSKQSSQLQGETSVGPITEETNIQGVQKLYKVLVTISKGRGYDKSVGGRRLLCLMASERYIYADVFYICL